MKKLKIVLIGNPNCGKSTIFNALTGSKQTVGNWPGVTVEKRMGNFEYGGIQVEITDLPGIYSLHNTDSLDEKIARDFLATADYDLIVNIVDSSNLQRHLYLTLQLLEIGTPVILALNMTDIAKNKGSVIGETLIQETLGISAIKLIAYKKIGMELLRKTIIEHISSGSNPDAIIARIYPSTIYNLIRDSSLQNKVGRWQIIQALEFESIPNEDVHFRQSIQSIKHQIYESYAEDSSIIIPGLRYEFIHKILEQIEVKNVVQNNMSSILDKIFLNKFLGIPLFLLIIYCAFTFSIVIGGAFQDFFELASEALFIDIPRIILTEIHSPDIITFMIADCIGTGIQTVLTFVPIIGGLYLFLSFLEESGYLLRGAYLVDKALRVVGLPGKAFFPLIIGFGCNVPSIMATRIIKNHEDRIAVAMVAPFMSCGARLSVYALFCAAFFPHTGQNIVFALYIVGIIFGLLTGWLVKQMLFKNRPDHLVLELVDYHLPTFKSLLIKTYNNLRSFVFGAGKLIIIVSVVLQCLNSLSFDFSTGNENNGKSIIAMISKQITPILEPIGIKEDNWPASVGLITGIFAKEVVVGTLNSLYLSMAEQESPPPNLANVTQKLGMAFQSIPDNLSKITNQLLMPLWLNLSDQKMLEGHIGNEGISVLIYRSMQEGFDGKIGAFAYLLFILLYFPCVSVFGIIAREVGIRWAVFSAIWSTTLAYIIALTFYQGAKLIFL